MSRRFAERDVTESGNTEYVARQNTVFMERTTHHIKETAHVNSALNYHYCPIQMTPIEN